MRTAETFNEKMLSYLGMIAKEGIHNAAKGFSGMLGQELSRRRPGNQIPAAAGDRQHRRWPGG